MSGYQLEMDSHYSLPYEQLVEVGGGGKCGGLNDWGSEEVD